MNQIWRFYTDPAHQWRWQRLAFDGTVLEHSKSGLTTYDNCVANACKCGYVFAPALSTKPESKPSKMKRSSMRFPTSPNKRLPR